VTISGSEKDKGKGRDEGHHPHKPLPLPLTRNRIRGQSRLVHDPWANTYNRWGGGIVIQVT
jgi:hypothetical protein